MDLQWILNLVLGVGLAVFGWFARELWASVASLRSDIKQIEVSMPVIYVSKADYQERMQRIERENNDKFDRIMSQLDRIYDKIDSKADK